MLELGVRRTRVPALVLPELHRRALPPVHVDRDSLGDGQHPGTEVLGVAERRVGAQGAEERVLKGVVRALSAQPGCEQPEHSVAVLGVEVLEGRSPHSFHHRC